MKPTLSGAVNLAAFPKRSPNFKEEAKYHGIKRQTCAHAPVGKLVNESTHPKNLARVLIHEVTEEYSRH
jgi:hypothetical protein